MNALLSLFRKPEPLPHVVIDTLPMRAADGQFAPSPRTLERCRKRGSVNAQLGVYVALTSPEKRRAAFEAFIARKREGE
jgi:hypothetical protein